MATKKTAAKKKYGPAAAKSVAREMKAFEQGKLRSGSGAKVKSRKQAIAIGLSEARAGGAKVPPAPTKKSQRRKVVSSQSTYSLVPE